MGWLAEQGAWKVNKVLKKLYQGEVKVTQHFVIRLFERFDIVARRSILRELHFLIRSGKYPTLFESGKKDTRIEINNNTLCLSMSAGGRLVLKTIFPTGKGYCDGND